MAGNAEMVKYTSLLQRDSAISKFKSSFEQCRLRARTSNVQANDGEMMAVCAYLAGREVAGSAATRESCARLGCMTLKVFDRVEDAVRKLLVQGPSRRALTVTSLAEKYEFPENDLEATQGVEFTLKYSITQELQDERVVCGVFSLICKHLGHSSTAWLEEEAKIHDLDLKEITLVTKRLEVIHGPQIETVIRRYKEGGRASRRKETSLVKQKSHRLSSMAESSSSPTKRKALADSLPRPSPLKRPKYSMESGPSTAPSSQRAASPVPSSASEATSVHSSIITDLVFDDMDRREDESAMEDGWEAQEPDSDKEYPVDLEDIGGLTWEDLAQARRKVLIARSASRPPRTVFADRVFWSNNTV